MNQSRPGEGPIGDLIDLDLPAEEFDRLVYVDALLRVAAAHDLCGVIGRSASQPAAAPTRFAPASVKSRAKW